MKWFSEHLYEINMFVFSVNAGICATQGVWQAAIAWTLCIVITYFNHLVESSLLRLSEEAIKNAERVDKINRGLIKEIHEIRLKSGHYKE